MVKVIEESFGKFVRVVPPEELSVAPHKAAEKPNAPQRPVPEASKNKEPMEPGHGFPTIYEESFGGATRRVVSIEEINAAIAARNAPKP